MRNFHPIAMNADIRGLALALQKTNLWNQNTLRKNHPSGTFREVDDIWLRMADLNKSMQASQDPTLFVDHRESINYPGWYELPQARELILGLMTVVGGIRLGRCLISRMKPGKRMLPHSDIGQDLTVYYDNEQYYQRHHIVIQGLPGSLFRCGEETVCMQTGEVWWFNNAIEHEIINNSADDRIHLVVDIRS
jgi:hypothetical protein